MFLEILLLVIVILLTILFLQNRKPPGTPPGTTGLPIIGEIPPGNVSFDQYCHSLRLKYGDIFWLKMGEWDHVILCKYEDIVAAFNNPALQGRAISYTTILLYKFGVKDSCGHENHNETLGIVNSQGEKWKNIRRFVIRRLRDGGMGKSSMEGIILREAEALVEDFEKHIGHPTEIPWSVNISILNIVWGIIGDRRYEINDEEIKTLCTNLNELINISQDRLLIFDSLTWLAKYTPTFILNYCGKKEVEEKLKGIYALFHKAIEEHKETLDEDNPRDLIDSYLIDLKRSEEGNVSDSDYCSTFSERELTQALFDLFVAGSETTSSTIKWFILYMAKYPEIQKKVHVEIDSVLPRERGFSLSEKDRFPYLEACISEALRLKSILPFGLFHSATENTKIKDFFIPKGTEIGANIIACHRDPSIWEKPEQFYPEHFLNQDGTFNNNKQGLISFSTGRRVCLGENLARMDLYLVLGTLMQKFNFTSPEGEVMSDEADPNQPYFTFPKPFQININKRC